LPSTRTWLQTPLSSASTTCLHSQPQQRAVTVTEKTNQTQQKRQKTPRQVDNHTFTLFFSVFNFLCMHMPSLEMMTMMISIQITGPARCSCLTSDWSRSV
jgi:hypothetical protein